MRLRGINVDRIQAESDSIIREGELLTIRVKAILKRRGGEEVIIGSEGKFVPSGPRPDPILIKNLTQAYAWKEVIESGEYASIHALAEREKCDDRHVRKLLRLAYLAPDIVESILDGRQPGALRMADLTHHKLPLSWKEQRIQLGFTG